MEQEIKQKFELLIKKNCFPDKSVISQLDSLIDVLHSAYLLDREEWISVDDDFPKYEQEVQICNNLDEWISQGYYLKYELRGEHKDWFNSYDNQCPCYPTHWRPLPKKPNQ